MRRVAPSLRLATSVVISNVWLLEDTEGRRFLIDTGHPLERPILLLSLWRAGVRRPGDLAAILLTHRHSDHAGNAASLRRRFRCPVVCHEDDAPALSGKSAPPALGRRRRATFVHEVLCRIEDRFPALCPVDETFGPARWRHGFTVFPVPGHTEGSVMLHHEPSGALFSGDAILSGPPPLRFIEWLRLAVPEYSLDVERCHREIRRHLEVLPRTATLCSGHGGPLHDPGEKLRRLLEAMKTKDPGAPGS